MDQNDPGSVLSPTTTTADDPDAEQLQDPAFSHEFTPDDLPRKDPKQEQEEDDEYVTTLFARESGYQLGSSGDSDKAWIQPTRLHSIRWVMQRRVGLGFRYRTAYLSIMYFDRFLSLQSPSLQGKEWRMRLLALTCLSLAAKMEEVKVPPLSAYGGGDAAFSFGTKWIKKMELRVLNVLQWEMRFISPLSFIHFFIRNLFPSPGGEAVSEAALIVFQAATVISTMDYKPSVMAMASTLLVMDESLTKTALEAKISASSVSNYGFAATAEQVYACYEVIKKQVLLDNSALLLVMSPSSSGSSGVRGKRRRLNNNGCGS